MSADEIQRISSGSPLSLIDRRKPSFKKLGIGDKVLSDQEAIALMQQEPSIIRRPIFEIDGEIVFGYNEAEMIELLA